MVSNNESTLFASHLIQGDEEQIDNLISKAIVNPENLRDFFKELLCFSALYQRYSWSMDGVAFHPLIQLNALKNLASLRLNQPSKLIAEKAIEISQKSIKSRIDNGELNISDDELNKPLFTHEFISAIKSGDIEKAKIEAKKISMVSDNPSSVIEIIMEIGIMNMDELGAFVYSVYRSSIFSGSKNSHVFIALLLSCLDNRQWSFDIKRENQLSDLSLFMNFALENSNLSELNLFSTAIRLWNGECVRQTNFREGLSFWAINRFDALSIEESKRTSSINNSKKDIIYYIKSGNVHDLSNALIRAQSKNEWTWPANLVELWIKSSKSLDINFDHLDSVQSLAKGADPFSMVLIAKRLIEINGRSV
ncbi:MAG: hypothetical protein CMG75_00730 [Candidatus Marinimicrobia bacterium]|nr:hypothetical protein [Candidatus Neomarinimicrobiota bacterium]|tara:strand:- start:5111 stop:6202 length:1092 start_codon:yes stop_codon:yes gene_type:complete